MTFKLRFTDLTSDCQLPPIQGLTGGLNFKSIFFPTKCLLIETWSRVFILYFSSVEAPTKFVPLSDLMTLTVPILAKNRLRERMKKSVGKSPGISRWTALVDRHVNKTMQRFAVARLDLVHFDNFIWYGPK